MGPRDREATVGFLKMLRSQDPQKNAYLKFMPPFAGSENDAGDLAAYLQTLR